jgi:hypothetical protein
MVEQPQGLISVLLDKSARVDERDAAAMDLSLYDDPEVERALVETATDPITDAAVAGSCGESLAEIWDRRGHPDLAALHRLPGEARSGALEYLRASRPEWIADIETP